ncbi:hypothetical protein VTO42DRAFT_2970 [Malbranchea cinnamomea]
MNSFQSPEYVSTSNTAHAPGRKTTSYVGSGRDLNRKPPSTSFSPCNPPLYHSRAALETRIECQCPPQDRLEESERERFVHPMAVFSRLAARGDVSLRPSPLDSCSSLAQKRRLAQRFINKGSSCSRSLAANQPSLSSFYPCSSALLALSCPGPPPRTGHVSGGSVARDKRHDVVGWLAICSFAAGRRMIGAALRAVPRVCVCLKDACGLHLVGRSGGVLGVSKELALEALARVNGHELLRVSSRCTAELAWSCTFLLSYRWSFSLSLSLSLSVRPVC